MNVIFEFSRFIISIINNWAPIFHLPPPLPQKRPIFKELPKYYPQNFPFKVKTTNEQPKSRQKDNGLIS